MQHFISTILLLFCTQVLLAQVTLIPKDFPLSDKNGNTMRHPWAGGINLPQFSAVDLNNDNIMDLVVYDRDALSATPYLNLGTPNQVDYQYAPEYITRLPQGIYNFMLFRDYNCDGIMDIFAHSQPPGQGSGVGVWEGSYDSNNKIQYTKIKDILYYEFAQNRLGNIFVFNSDIPAIDDVDGDGDLDILCFTLNFSFAKNIQYYKNTSVENGYGCDSLTFRLENACFGQFEETGIASICNFSPSIDSCRNNPYWDGPLRSVMPHIDDIMAYSYTKNGRHIGASIAATIDYNGDGAKDIALGGVSYNNLNMITTTLVGDTLLGVSQDTFFPSYDRSVNVYSFASSYFLDVNNDGKTDMIAAPTETGRCEAVKDSVAWYYENTGTNTNMQFSFQQKNFLVEDMLDVGQDAFPVIFDFTGDGLLDILVGTQGRCQDPNLPGIQAASVYQTGFTLLTNIGTMTAPAFELTTTNYAQWDTISKNRLYPTMGDLDGDGDMDMIFGSDDGKLTFLKNEAAAGVAPVWATPTYNYQNINLNYDSAPSLGDLDGDGDLDLVIGDGGGHVKYFQNNGSSTMASFSTTSLTDTLGGYGIAGNFGRTTTPLCYDNNGSWELYIGQQNGKIAHLNNINNNVLGVYDTITENLLERHVGQFVSLAVADLNNDGFLDYVVGTVKGGLTIWTDSNSILSQANIAETTTPNQLQVFPNPATQQVNLRLDFPTAAATQVLCYNALGQLVHSANYATGQQQYQLQVADLPAGVYFVQLQSKESKMTATFVKE